MSWAAAASAGLTLWGMKVQHDANKAQQENLKKLAFEKKKNAAIEAYRVKNQARNIVDQIREQAERVRSAQAQQQAASGVVVGVGSGAALMSEAKSLSEADALATIYEAEMKADSIIRGSEYEAESLYDSARAVRRQQELDLIRGVSDLSRTYYSSQRTTDKDD